MLDSIEPYDIHFIQKASPTSNGDAFDFSYIYKFRTERTVKYQSLKYIIRVEAIGDLFAIKFYAARDGKLDNKYNRLIQAYNYSQTLRIFLTCASVVPLILSDHPFASFVINGAQTIDKKSDKIESKANNQRFRLYKYVAEHLFGDSIFQDYEFPEVSSYLIVNRNSSQDVEQKKNEIKERLFNLYDIDI